MKVEGSRRIRKQKHLPGHPWRQARKVQKHLALQQHYSSVVAAVGEFAQSDSEPYGIAIGSLKHVIFRSGEWLWGDRGTARAIPKYSVIAAFGNNGWDG